MARKRNNLAHLDDSPEGPRALYSIDWRNPAAIPDEVLRSFILQQYRAAKDRRREAEIRAMQILRWSEGDQAIDWDQSTLDVDRIISRRHLDGIPNHQQDPIEINSLKNILLQRIALLLGGPITMVAAPGSAEEEDVYGARMQTKLLQYTWRGGEHPVRRDMVRALWQMFCAGSIWIHPMWDAWSGEALRKTGKNQNVETSKDQSPAGQDDEAPDGDDADDDGEMLHAGAVRWKWRSIWDISEPADAGHLADLPWLIDSEWVTLEELAHRYGSDKVKDIRPDNDSEDYHRAMGGHHGLLGGDWSGVGDSGHDGRVPAESVLTHRFWRPVRPWSPRGVYVVVAGTSAPESAVLHKGPHPYPHGRLPFVQLAELPGPSIRPWGTLHSVMPLQESRNRLRSQAHSWVHKMVAAKILHEVNSGLNTADLDNEHRAIQVNEGGIDKVRAFEMPRLPGELIALDERLRQDIADVSAVHDSTQGRAESKQQSGRHAAVLAEGNMRNMFSTREMLQSAMAEAGNQTLWLWWHHVKEKRAIEITGDDMTTEVVHFQGGQLLGKGKRPGPRTFNVQCNIVPDTAAEAQLAKIETLTSMGYWSPERDEDRLRVERMLGESIPSEHDEHSRARRDAAAENYRLIGGKGDAMKRISVALGDRHDLHIAEHDDFTTTAAYRDAVDKDATLAEAMLAHRFEHLRQQARLTLLPQLIEESEKAALLAAHREQLGLPAQEAAPPGPAGGMPGIPGMDPAMNGGAPGMPPGMAGPPGGPMNGQPMQNGQRMATAGAAPPMI